MSTDRHRQSVYDAEDAIAPALERGAVIEHFGSTLVAPMERRFGRVEDVQSYVDRVLAHPPVATRFPRAGSPVTVRARRVMPKARVASAHYEFDNAVIAVPATAFGLRETTVLHEIAHHLDSPGADPAGHGWAIHGASFTQTLVDLYALVLGAEAAHLLRVEFSTRGVPVGTDAGATSAQALAARAPRDETTMLDRLSKILNQAENASTEAEAEAFFARAQQLATRYSIDLAVARQHTAKQQKRETPETRHVRVGKPRERGNAEKVQLFSAIAGANDVRIDIARDSTIVFPYGFPSDLDVVEALFAHLSVQMVTAAGAYLKRGDYLADIRTRVVKKQRWVGDHSCRRCDVCSPVATEDADDAAEGGVVAGQRYFEHGCEDCEACAYANGECLGQTDHRWWCGDVIYRENHGYGHWDRAEVVEERAPSAQSARISFYKAFAARIGARLDEARAQAEAAVAAEQEAAMAALIEEQEFLRAGAAVGEQTPAEQARLAELDGLLAAGRSDSTALVLASKRGEVQDFYDQNSDARGTWRGAKRKTNQVASARRAGDAAGRTAALRGTQALPSGPRSLT